MNGLFAPLDLYCERTDASFWSEPVNALTNLLFIAAGIYGLSRVRANSTGGFAAALCWGVIVVGIGSLLFHTTAIELTKWADIIPIAVLTLALTLFFLHRLAGLGWSKTIVFLISYFVVTGALTYLLIPQSLWVATNGSIGYLPAGGAFVFCGIVILISRSAGGWYSLACAAIFVFAVYFRTIDPTICASFPLGTHFLWHSLNALMLGVALVAVAKYGAPRTAYR
jgi:hypothetical protein